MCGEGGVSSMASLNRRLVEPSIRFGNGMLQIGSNREDETILLVQIAGDKQNLSWYMQIHPCRPNTTRNYIAFFQCSRPRAEPQAPQEAYDPAARTCYTRHSYGMPYLRIIFLRGRISVP